MDEMILETIRPCLYDVNGRRIALTNCWPIASALLGFEDVVAFNKAINRHEGSSENVPDATATMSASSRPFPRATTSMVGYSIYLRAMDMSPNIRRFLLGLIIESVLSEANSSSEKDVINAMHLLHILSVGDTGLIRQYTAMLASLVGEESSHDIISLALNHLQYAANHLNQNGWKSDGAITGGCSKVVTRYWHQAIDVLSFLTIALHVHCTHGAQASLDHGLLRQSWDLAISAAATSSVNISGMILHSRLTSLLWSIEENISYLAEVQGYRFDLLNIYSWRAIEDLLWKDGVLIPPSLIRTLTKCTGVTPDEAFIDEHKSQLATAIKSYTTARGLYPPGKMYTQ
jgi:hypothetical protein